MRILLAVDDSPHSQAALEAVLDHVRAADGEVRVLHVAEWPLGGPPYLSFGIGPRAISGVLLLRDQALAAAHTLVDETVARLRKAGFDATGVVLEGAARSSIVDVAARWQADLIVMGSHGRRGLDRVALGSVAESVLRRATCSVEIVRSVAAPAQTIDAATHDGVISTSARGAAAFPHHREIP